MVYRKKSGHIAFNDYDITEFMTRQFNKADNKDELYLIKDTFDKIMDNIIKRISLTMDNRTMTEKEELEQQNTEMRMKYWNW